MRVLEKKTRVTAWQQIPRTVLIILIACLYAPAAIFASEFNSNLPLEIDRTWIGPEYWTNPMQDWRLADGRIECTVSGGDRNFHILTHDIADKEDSFKISVTAGRMDGTKKDSAGWIGFKLGAKCEFDDYRARAVFGQGLNCGVDNKGKLFIGDYRDGTPQIKEELDDLTLTITAEPLDDNYEVSLMVSDASGTVIGEISRDDIVQDELIGGIAVVCSAGAPVKKPDGSLGYVFSNPAGYWSRDINNKRNGSFRYWFKDISISGNKIAENKAQKFGPVIGVQYTLSRNIMKMTAQLVPVSDSDGKEALLQLEIDDEWVTIASAKIDPVARTAAFRLEDWDSTKNKYFRIKYNIVHSGNKIEEHYYEGRIRGDPAGKEELVVAAFTGIKDRRFPHSDLTDNVEIHKPDLLVFTGDQIYESVGGYGYQTEPLDAAVVDYLRKWYLFLWSFGELTRDIPCITIPDDHDVFHGNLWGAEGRDANEGSRKLSQDNGGYKMPPEFVNMVERTQTSHLPDPADPKPVKRGIGVYYTELRYGGISFAVIEDRKWKSAPAILLPKADIYNGFARNTNFHAPTEARTGYAALIGKRQIDFLEKWAADWTGDIWAKAVISQTIFANVATLPAGSDGDKVVPTLEIHEENAYAANDAPVADFDSNGWPQGERDIAVKMLRKACAVHIAGDQHLGSTLQYGINSFSDAGYALCVPASDNAWPRRWMPLKAGVDHLEGAPRYTGGFLDGFANRMTVLAVSNPHKRSIAPAADNSLSPGYGIARFRKFDRSITLEAWPRWVNPDSFGAKPYPGWPIRLNMLDNLGTAGVQHLPVLKFAEKTDHIVQVIDQATREIQYTVRVSETEFRPPVYHDGTYTIKTGIPGTAYAIEYYGLKPGIKSSPLKVNCIPKKSFLERLFKKK